MRRLLPLFIIPIAIVACGRATPTRTSKLKLLVLVVFDQMRGDYLSQWADQFGDDGFRRICTEGAWFTDCHYPYACSMTGPGHASLLTGCSPDRHGIIMNEWYDRAIGKEVYCATTDRYRTVYTVANPPAEPKASATREVGSGCPDRMLAQSLGEVLKSGTGGASKMFALSHKDRSACLPGGKNPDACYWFDDKSGSFVTSTYYKDRAHPWVTSFNDAKPADRWFGKTWERFRPDLNYDQLAGPDDERSEAISESKKRGRVFPHTMSVGKPTPEKGYYDEIVASPFGNELLLEFAKHAVKAAELGRGEATDLLSVSFSSNDLVGHRYGPDSHEVLDITLCSDRIVAELLKFLDAHVGEGQYMLALTADHGICPMPEVSAAKGLDAVRLHPDNLRKSAEKFLDEKYGIVTNEKSRWIDDDAFPWVYLNHRKLGSRKLEPKAVAEVLASWVRTQSWAAAAYTRAQLEKPSPHGDKYIDRMKKAYFPGRSGDLALVLKPYYLSSTYETGTTHGSPHPYDTHVPLIFFGPGIVAGKSAAPVTPQAIAAVFAQAAGVKPPAQIDADVPNGLFAKSGAN